MAVASRAAVLMTITVLIADDQPVMRDGLRMILTSQDDIAVVGEAANGNEAVQLTADLAPDVILMDIQMPELDGIEATRRITSAADASRVLILTTFALDEYVFDAFQAGAAGFLVKNGAAAIDHRRRPDGPRQVMRCWLPRSLVRSLNDS